MQRLYKVSAKNQKGTNKFRFDMTPDLRHLEPEQSQPNLS
jgi:hypothetical protein